MKVAIGTKNPAKINAVERGFLTMWPDTQFEFVGVPVESGVSDQPMSDEEGIKGATTRATSALQEQSDADFGVGLEGSIRKTNDTWFATAWIVVVDKSGKKGVGAAPTVMIPQKLAGQMLAGEEMKVVIDRHFKIKDSGKKEGFFGIMTNNKITRSDGYKYAVINALAPFIHEDLF